VSEDIRDRWINPGKDIPNGALDALIERLITAGPDAVSADLNKLISDHYVRDMSITNIEVIDY
jgi:CRISPR/Cas system-associated protein Csm6